MTPLLFHMHSPVNLQVWNFLLTALLVQKLKVVPDDRPNCVPKRPHSCPPLAEKLIQMPAMLASLQLS
jgi:hypothetical protein